VVAAFAKELLLKSYTFWQSCTFIKGIVAKVFEFGAKVNKLQIDGISFIATALVSLPLTIGLIRIDTSVISGAIEFIETPKVFNLNVIQKGWTVSCIIVGCLMGCVFAGPLSDKYGRKKLVIVTALIFLLSSLGCALATSNFIFIINRIIAGFAVGSASMLAPIYIAEISPSKHRGKLVSLNLFAIFLGQSAAFFSNFY